MNALKFIILLINTEIGILRFAHGFLFFFYLGAATLSPAALPRSPVTLPPCCHDDTKIRSATKAFNHVV
jgi:hypothetical protein